MSKSSVPAGNRPGGKAGDRLQLSSVSIGIASVVAASTAGFGAQAQEQAPAPAQTQLPPLEVSTQKAAPKKAKAKKSSASSSVSPQPQGPATQVAAPTPTPSEQLGLTPPSGNSLQGGTGLGRLPGTLQDTPQVVNVVGQEQIKQQNITTLEQALKNVPGVTVSIGEGGGGFNGDQFRIRGIQAKNDIYLDGLRDFGVYVRDSFAYEEVQVLKGPSSESFGMGTTGGVINTISKTAVLGDFTTIEGSYGNGDLYRSTVDVNKQIDAHTAMRVFAMINEQDIVDRCHMYSDRWGIGASLAFGLGTDTKWSLNYLYNHGDRMPDYGVPMLVKSGTASATNPNTPITEHWVPRDTFYGKETDHDIYDVHLLTSKLKKDVMPGLTVYNDTRLSFYERDFASGPAECSGACLTAFQTGNPSPQFNYGGGNPAFLQDSWGIQNLTSAVAKFNTGFLRHEAVVGVDAFYQEDERTLVSAFNSATNLTTGANRNGGGTNLYNPTFGATGYYMAPNPLGNNGQREASATDFAVFASDRVWVTKELSILAGTRWDDYRAEYRYWCSGVLVNPCPTSGQGWSQNVEANTQFWSPKASVIWEPSKNETYYVSWAASTTPPGTAIANDVSSIEDPNNPGGGGAPVAGNPILKPEENESYEVGGKVSFLDGKLGLSGALFRVDKSNQSYVGAAGDPVQTGDAIRVQGVELGVTGSVTEAWTIMAGYSYLDGEVTKSPTAANVGHEAQQIPENNFSFWTTYEISKLFNLGPDETVVGGGVSYADGYFTSNANNSWVPHSFSLDALVSYELDNWRVAVNGYNLTDELNYSASQSSRAVLGPGRSFVMTVGKRF